MENLACLVGEDGFAKDVFAEKRCVCQERCVCEKGKRKRSIIILRVFVFLGDQTQK